MALPVFLQDLLGGPSGLRGVLEDPQASAGSRPQGGRGLDWHQKIQKILLLRSKLDTSNTQSKLGAGQERFSFRRAETRMY